MFTRVLQKSIICANHAGRSILKTSKSTMKLSPIQCHRGLSSTDSSSSGSSIFSKLTGSSSDSPPSDPYAKQIYDMAKAESWTLNHFSEQMKAMSGGWKAKLPFLNNTDHVKEMKKMQNLIDATMEIVGRQAGSNELKDIGKKEKLMICLKCESDFQDVNALITQFKSMDIMHRVLRYRVDNGMPIPTSEDEAKNVMQSDMRKVLTSREWKDMQRARMRSMKR